MLEDHVHREILEKFHHLKGSVLIGKERIKGKGKEQRVPADEYVSSEHMMHDLIRGFYKPKGMPFLLSYQATESDENYGKQIVWNDQSLLEFKKIKMAPPSAVKDNRKISDIAAARYNLAHQIPIGLLHKVRKGVNVVLGLGLITEEDINGNFIVVPYLPKTFIGKDFKDANLILPLETNDHQNMVTEVVREIKQRKGQLKFKQYLLEKYSTCTVCDVVAKHTIASHIKPWSICKSDERLNVNNGLLLCPNHDYLFDRGFISFDRTGIIILSEKMSMREYEQFNINPKIRISVTESMDEFLTYHRTYILKK